MVSRMETKDYPFGWRQLCRDCVSKLRENSLLLLDHLELWNIITYFPGESKTRARALPKGRLASIIANHQHNTTDN